LGLINIFKYITKTVVHSLIIHHKISKGFDVKTKTDMVIRLISLDISRKAWLQRKILWMSTIDVYSAINHNKW